MADVLVCTATTQRSCYCWVGPANKMRASRQAKAVGNFINLHWKGMKMKLKIIKKMLRTEKIRMANVVNVKCAKLKRNKSK